MNSELQIRELAKLFLKLGIIGFGGPAVHIALMQQEVVKKRGWMSDAQFMDLVGATNLIPGPNSTEMTMHIGQQRAGWKGLLTAGCCFILPAVVITGFFAWLYKIYGQLPQVQPYIYGIKPAIIAVVFSLMIVLGKKALKTIELGVIGILAGAAVLMGLNEIYVLFGSGFLGMMLLLIKKQQNNSRLVCPVAILEITNFFLRLPEFRIFFTFLKIGSILYGSGYVLFAFLDAELVGRGWINKTQLTDAIAVGQFTPGPVFSSATFIGWQMDGFSGAVMATVGIFLPSFIFVALLNPLIPFLRRSTIMSAFLDAINIASVAIIFSVMIELSRYSIQDWRTVVIACTSFAITFLFPRINTAFIIAGGALLGYVLHLV